MRTDTLTLSISYLPVELCIDFGTVTLSPFCISMSINTVSVQVLFRQQFLGDTV